LPAIYLHMALYPPEATAIAWTQLEDIRAWVGLPPVALTAIEATTGSFNDNIRNLAILPASTVVAAVQAARVALEDSTEEVPSERALSPVEAAQFGLVWRIAGRISATAGGVPWAQAAVDDPLAPATPAPPTPSPTPPATGDTGPAKTSQRKVKLNLVLDQGDESEVSPASKATVAKWYDNYLRVAMGPPQEECEPHEDQLAALHFRVFVALASPYADFAVFGPFGRRSQRSGKFRVWLPVGDGTYRSKELPGPENFRQWDAAWRVFAVACVMIDVASLASLNLYHAAVEKLASLWPSAWHLIVTAEDKMRAEQFDRIARRIAASVAAGSAAPADWSEAAPWSAVFRHAAEDVKFWDDNVRHPAAAWMAAGGRGAPIAPDEKLAEVLKPGGAASVVAPVEGPAASTKRAANSELRRPSKKDRLRARRMNRQDDANPKEQWSSGAPASSSASGGGKGKSSGSGKGKQHLTDQSGTQVCISWNKGFGECADAKDGSPCPKGRAHKCLVCLSPAHRSKNHS